MANGKDAPVKVRSVTSTFSLKDVAVVAVAAFTAAAPFFAYDTRISVVESKVEHINESDHALGERVKQVERDLFDHLKDYEQEKAAAATRQREEENK